MNLTQQRKAKYDQAQALVDSASGDLTATQKSQFDTLVSEVKALDEKIARATKSQATINDLGRLGDDEEAPQAGAGGLFDAEQQRGIVAAVKSRTAFRAEVGRKALTGASVPVAVGAVAPGVYPSGTTGLAELFPSETIQAPSVRYYRFNTSTAAVVAEGALKPDSGVAVVPVDLTLEKLASTARFSDEFSDDAPYLLQHVSDELIRAVVTVENGQILAALGAASGVLLKTGTYATAIDTFADAISGSETFNGTTPTAIAVDPATLGSIRKSKASTSGGYHLDPVSAGPATLHGVRLVSSPAVTAGEGWLISPGAALIYRRGPVVVDVGHNADDWQRNMRTLRVEQRMAAAVLRPSLLTKVTLT